MAVLTIPKIKRPPKVEEIPHLLQIELSYACNARCIFCYNPSRGKLTDNTITDNIIEATVKAHIPHVQLTGGEVSLYPVEKLNKYIDLLSEDSTVSIQTNSIRYLEGLSKNLAVIYVSLHGLQKTHESLNPIPGSFERITSNIRRYLKDGFEVNCDFTLTSKNYKDFYKVAKLVASYGVKQVSVNKFESGGMGSAYVKELSPTEKQFEMCLKQMLKARKFLGIFVGFCTAIPYCLHPKLIEEGFTSNCGAGFSFAAIDPKGNLRICNQSLTSYGNILKEPLKKIWHKKALEEFRNLEWITSPCSKCPLLYDCLAGCKVDQTSSKKYCVDYTVRERSFPPRFIFRYLRQGRDDTNNLSPLLKIDKEKSINLAPFTKLNLYHQTPLLLTRYQTIKIDKKLVPLLSYIISKKTVNISELIHQFPDTTLKPEQILKSISSLVQAKAVYIC